MQGHVKILAGLTIFAGALGVLAALVVFALFGGIARLVQITDRSSDAPLAVSILGFIAIFLFILILILSVPSLVAGYGLLQFREWARILTIILSVLHLVNVPFGTILGVYGLWVLTHAETQRLFAASQTGRVGA